MSISEESYAGQLARLLTARDLQWPLGPTLPAEMTAAEASEILWEEALGKYDPTTRFSIVKKANTVVGYVTMDVIQEGTKSLAAFADQIPPDRIVHVSTPALDIFNKLEVPHLHPFFVKEKREITGTIGAGEFMGVPFRLCLFAITIELEETARDLLLKDAQASWDSLPQERRDKATQLYKDRPSTKWVPSHEYKPYREWLECTELCDKGTILRKRGLVGDMSKSKLKELFEDVERLRDACAHPNRDRHAWAIFRLDKLRETIRGAQELTESLRLKLEEDY